MTNLAGRSPAGAKAGETAVSYGRVPLPFSSMNRFHLTTVALCTVFSFSAAAYAQETAEPAPQEPPTAEEEVWQRRFDRAEGFRIIMLQTRRGVELFYSFQKKNTEDLLANRERCREDLRRANRDAQFSTLLHCYQRELVLDRGLHEKKRQYMESIPGISSVLRDQALLAEDAFLPALDALLKGVENDVFTDREDLIEAKKNFHSAYRVPALLAELRVEADRSLTWVAHLLHQLFLMTQNTELGPEAFEKTSEAFTCFEEGETQLMGLNTIEGFKDANAALGESLAHLQTCTDLLREAHRLQQLFENPPPPEETEENREELSPRRRWKNL